MFGFGKKDDLKVSRENNIKELKLSYSQIKKANPNSDTVWELLFSTPLQGGQFNTLKITLPPEFPNTKPVMQVVGPLVHVWLDNFKYVTGCVLLNNWMKDSSLSDAVQHVLTGLQTGSGYTTTTTTPSQPSISNSNTNKLYPIYPAVNQSPGGGGGGGGTLANNTIISPLPPPIPFEKPGMKISSTQYPPTYTQAIQQGGGGGGVGYGSSSSSSSGGSGGGNGNNNTNYGRAIHESHQLNNNNNNNKITTTTTTSALSSQERRDISRSDTIERQTSLSMPMPDIPNDFPEIKDKTEKELQAYLNDPPAFQALIHSLTSVEAMTDIRDDIRESNAKQAALTLEKGNLTELHQQVTDLQALLKTQVKAYKETLNSQAYEYCVPAPQVKLKVQEKLDILEAKTEEIANRFVAGECDLNAFLKEYAEYRQEYYMVETKLKLVSNNSSSNSNNGNNNNNNNNKQ